MIGGVQVFVYLVVLEDKCMYKHKCDTCSKDSYIESDSWWSENFIYKLVARHIHTGCIQVLFVSNDYSYIEEYKNLQEVYCHSHENFKIVSYTEN